MSCLLPVIIGGNGHSGTRIFTEIITRGGVFTGIRGLTKRRESEDLKIIDLLTRWAHPYVYGKLEESSARRMKKEFKWRLRLYFPLRNRPWGFKNPRTLLLLPFFDEIFPGLKFVHVVRDGRDISLGNNFATSNRYADAFLSDEEKQLPPEEKMIFFWGRSNAAAMDYGSRHMGDRYALFRWEDLCTNARVKTSELLKFAGCPSGEAEEISNMVRTPKSLGRWKTYPAETAERVTARGERWLKQFGYL